ncbi:MAG: hypothetical protein ACRC22_06565, partial [Shewanella sp.]
MSLPASLCASQLMTAPVITWLWGIGVLAPRLFFLLPYHLSLIPYPTHSVHCAIFIRVRQLFYLKS